MTKAAEEFMACGRAHPSERDAVVTMIDTVRVTEAGGGSLFSGWARACKMPMLRGGLAMIAEREYYHARMFEKRMDELGAARKAQDYPDRAEREAYFANPEIADLAKVKRFNKRVGDPELIFTELTTLVERIMDDLESREMLRLYYEDELSSTRWLRDIEAKLTEAPARAA